MHKSESVLENERNNILWNFEIQTGQLVPARRPDFVISNKTKEKRNENLLYRASCCPSRPQSKNQTKQKDRQVLGACLRTKKTMEPTVIGTLRKVPKGMVRELEEMEIGGQVETIQTTALLRSAKIPRKVLET